MSLKKKIVLSFLVSAVIIALLSGFLYLNFVGIKKETDFLETADTIRSKALQLRRHEKNFLLYSVNQAAEAAAVLETLDDLERKVGGIAPDRSGVVIDLRRRLADYRGHFGHIETLLAEALRESNAMRRDAAYARVGPLIEANFLDKPLEDAAYLRRTFGMGEEERFIGVPRTAILVVFPLFVVVGFGAILYITGSLVRRLRLLSAVVEQTGTGHFAPLPLISGAGRADEVETLIRTFNIMKAQLAAREKELLQSKKLAAIGTLAAGVAHELNNPLSNIYLSTQVLVRELGDAAPPAVKEVADDIVGQTVRVKKIVGDLLSFARGRDPQLREDR